MKIAVHNPIFLFMDQNRNFNGYNFEFLKRYADIIYLSEPWNIFKYKKRICMLDELFSKKEIVFTIGALNKKAGILMSFNGRADLKKYAPPKKFNGLKIWHVMDYVFKAQAANEVLKTNGVDYVMGYTDHGKYCPFFKKYYTDYIGKVIPVPFGFSKRFRSMKSVEERINKVIALGAVNPVNDPLCKNGMLDEYINFYKEEKWTHKFRRILAERQETLLDVMDSRLPKPPETKNSQYDAVEEMNNYALFVNDEGLMNFPPARTYEGIACGSIMIASDSTIYSDLGFVDGENYISFSKNDFDDFKKKANQAIQNKSRLTEMQQKSLLLAENFSHEFVAKKLYEKIRSLYK